MTPSIFIIKIIYFSFFLDIREHRRWDQCSRFLISNCEHARIKYWDFENRTELKFGRNLGQFVRYVNINPACGFKVLK